MTQDKELMLEILKNIQADIAELKEACHEMGEGFAAIEGIFK